MDPSAIFERADARRHPGDLFPRGADETTWIAVDPETDCRGTGRFEEEARANLVYAVEAYREADGDVAPFVASQEAKTMEMRWLREDRSGSVLDRVREFSPF